MVPSGPDQVGDWSDIRCGSHDRCLLSLEQWKSPCQTPCQGSRRSCHDTQHGTDSSFSELAHCAYRPPLEPKQNRLYQTPMGQDPIMYSSTLCLMAGAALRLDSVTTQSATGVWASGCAGLMANCSVIVRVVWPRSAMPPVLSRT